MERAGEGDTYRSEEDERKNRVGGRWNKEGIHREGERGTDEGERARGRERVRVERKRRDTEAKEAVYFKVIDAIFSMTSFLIQSAGP